MEDDDFARRVYCVLGIPIDEISMAGLVGRIHKAASSRQPLFISTPNLNYLMLSQREPAFRRSLLESDICPADGVGVLLICRLLGIPVTSRVAGSDLPAALQSSETPVGGRPLRIALFGGAPGVGERAREAVNGGDTDRLVCVAAIDPGVMTIGKMVDPSYLEQINATEADFLLVALGAQKGQAWLMGNRQKLTVPVVSHLGATLNFLAGTVRRAPAGLRRLGLEWLWRIGQEPYLATRYLSDGTRLLGLMASRMVPLGLWLRWSGRGGGTQGLSVWLDTGKAGHIRVVIAGAARDDQLEPVAAAFRHAAQSGHGITLDVGGLQFFGMGFAGQVLMLEKAALKQNLPLAIEGATSSVARALKWCGLKHLLGEKAAM
jgi:N-acetylglucosaminyldiphosphoundecaprenol N-acetyl-beta-D-mannosaminyltransferase